MKEYDGTFWGRKSCYSITDIVGICFMCEKKFFVSRASVKNCMIVWRKNKDIGVPTKGINACCFCGIKSIQIDTSDIIEEVNRE